MRKRIVLLAIGAAVALSLTGCEQARQEERETFKFFSQDVQHKIDRLEKEIPRRETYGMQNAVKRLQSIIFLLPTEIDKRGVEKAEERTAAAKEALAFFQDRMRVELLSLRYDAAEMQDKLEQLKAIIERVDNP